MDVGTLIYTTAPAVSWSRTTGASVYERETDNVRKVGREDVLQRDGEGKTKKKKAVVCVCGGGGTNDRQEC